MNHYDNYFQSFQFSGSQKGEACILLAKEAQNELVEATKTTLPRMLFSQPCLRTNYLLSIESGSGLFLVSGSSKALTAAIKLAPENMTYGKPFQTVNYNRKVMSINYT